MHNGDKNNDATIHRASTKLPSTSSNQIHPSSTIATTKTTTKSHSSQSSKHRAKDLSGMSTKNDNNHKRHDSERLQSEPVARESSMPISQEQPFNENPQYPCQRFTSELLTYFLFLTSFFLSLSLYSIGQASGRVTIETNDLKTTSQTSGSYGIWTFLGFLGVMYSMIGLIMNCMGKLPYKVSSNSSRYIYIYIDEQSLIIILNSCEISCNFLIILLSFI